MARTQVIWLKEGVIKADVYKRQTNESVSHFPISDLCMSASKKLVHFFLATKEEFNNNIFIKASCF